MRVLTLSALDDNYMYLLVDDEAKEAAVVDPVNPKKVVEAVKAEKDIRLTTVLTTHHHWDHAGGNEELCSLVEGLTVYGGDDRIGKLNRKLADGDTFQIGHMTLRAMHTPCHTSGHICYYVTSPHAPTPAVFTGDTLFVGGCGKFFEGTPEQMQSAMSRLAALDTTTRVYCGHEYTVSNLKFAVSVEPQNAVIQAKLAECQALRADGKTTIPSTIHDELQYNPFMRTNVAAVHQHAGTTDPVTCMGNLRLEKNYFRPKI